MQANRQRLASRLTRLLAVVFAFALIAAACGSSDGDSDSDTAAADAESDTSDDGTSDETEEPADEAAEDGAIVETIEDEETETGPVAGGTLRFRVSSESPGLNPTSSTGAPSGLTMMNAAFDTLAAYDENGVAVPYLAESFTPNEDYTSWDIKLREGITFHDGTPLDADAAIRSYETVKNDFTIGIAVRPFVQEENSTEKIDDMTYRVNLVDPWLYFPTTVTGQLGMVASPTWLDAALEDPTLNQEPVGTGPFVFDSRSEDSVTRFVRNDDYWNGEVYLDAIEFHIVTDGDTAATLFLEGGLDGMHTNEPGAIEALADNDTVQNALDNTGEEQFDLINSEAPPFDDIRARRALTLASPQENYVALMGLGVTERADQMFSPAHRYHNPNVVQETDRPEEAATLAAEYCADFPENCTDNKINIERRTSGPSVSQTREADLLIEGWSAAFNTTSVETAEDEHINAVITGAYQVADWRQFGAVDMSLDNVWLLCRTVGPLSLNFPRFCDEERDALLLQAQVEPDDTVRAELYMQLVEMLNQDYLYVFYTHTLWDIAYKDFVRGACGRTTPEGAVLRCQVNGRTFYDKIWYAE